MKRILTTIGLGLGFLAFATGAGAQTWERRHDRDRDRDDNPYYRNNGYTGYRQSPVEQVLSDLNRAESRAYLDGHERKHFDEASRNLQDFQARWASGRFDAGKLDKAIHNIEHLAQADRVRAWDRDTLSRDLNELQQFRAGGGANYDPGYAPYRR